MTKANGFRMTIAGGTLPAEAWARFAAAALASVPPRDFDVTTASLVEVIVDVSRGCLPNPWTPVALKLPRKYVKGVEPTEICAEPHRPDLVPTPAFVGLGKDTATEVASVAEIKPTFVGVYGTGLPVGQVLTQSPGAGTPVRAGATVTLRVVGTPGGPTLVPNVTGLSPATAVEQLAAAGLIGSVVVQASCTGGADCAATLTKNAGLVWRQDLTAGSRATDGTPIVLLVELEAGSVDLQWPLQPSGPGASVDPAASPVAPVPGATGTSPAPTIASNPPIPSAANAPSPTAGAPAP